MDCFNTDIFIFLMLSGFAAGFIDGVAGGGGLLLIPALLFTGIPPQTVLGTNKFAATTKHGDRYAVS